MTKPAPRLVRAWLDSLSSGAVSYTHLDVYKRQVYHQFTITHPRRDALREHLASRGVGTDLIYPVPLHLQRCFAGLGQGKGSLPVAERAAQTCLSLPIYPELTDDQVGVVVEAVNSFRGDPGRP